MKTLYFLSTCSTCQRIIKQVNWPHDILFVDIKKQSISSETLDVLYEKFGSYEAVFSKKAKNFTQVKASIVSDADYKKLILSDYTFLKRPVILYGDFYSVGNDRAAIERLKLRFNLVNSK